MNSKRRYFSFGESARMAFETLLANKLRSALTVLGVFIAVVVLVMVFSIMYGVDADLRAQLDQYGTDTLFVFKFEPGIHVGRLPQELRMRKPLNYEDAEAIREERLRSRKSAWNWIPRALRRARRRLFPRRATVARRSQGAV